MEKPRVLIVDDEPAIVDLLAELLGGEYDCFKSFSAEEALRIIDQYEIDVVLSDINLGGKGGLEFLAEISRRPTEMAVMMMSGNQNIECPIDALRHGAFDYITKPIDLDYLTNAMRRAVRRREELVAKRRNEERIFRTLESRTARLEFLEKCDPVTGLANLRTFESELGNALRAARPSANVGVVLISLDRLGSIRDTLGHALADQLLREFAARLTDALAEEIMLARVESADFGVLVRDVSTTPLPMVVELINCEAAKPFNYQSQQFFSSVSLGVSTSTSENRHAHIILSNAGTALSKARSLGGGNCLFFDSAMNVSEINRLILESDLYMAIDRGELSVEFQPIIELGTGLVDSVEALLRWHRDSVEEVSAEDFIPIAEETGLIVPISEWMLREACLHAKRWHDRSASLRVAVRISPRQFGSNDFASRVRSITEEIGVDPQCLQLEITESVVMSDLEAAGSVLRGLRKSGVGIAIDNFGSRKASLEHLKALPVDTLKIDCSFVHDIATSRESEAVIDAILTLARKLDLKVIAKGVESEEQLRVLERLGCQFWQGSFAGESSPVEYLRLAAGSFA